LTDSSVGTKELAFEGLATKGLGRAAEAGVLASSSRVFLMF
jgi:hypothetical protein